MNEKHEMIISAMASFYDDYNDEVTGPWDLALRTCDTFNAYVPGTYRVPIWMHRAAEMIIQIYEDEHAQTT